MRTILSQLLRVTFRTSVPRGAEASVPFGSYINHTLLFLASYLSLPRRTSCMHSMNFAAVQSTLRVHVFRTSQNSLVRLHPIISTVLAVSHHGSECSLIVIIIIIIAPLTIVSEDQWGDLECLYKACRAAITDGGLFTDTGVDKRSENKRQNEFQWKWLWDENR